MTLSDVFRASAVNPANKAGKLLNAFEMKLIAEANVFLSQSIIFPTSGILLKKLSTTFVKFINTSHAVLYILKIAKAIPLNVSKAIMPS